MGATGTATTNIQHHANTPLMLGPSYLTPTSNTKGVSMGVFGSGSSASSGKMTPIINVGVGGGSIGNSMGGSMNSSNRTTPTPSKPPSPSPSMMIAMTKSNMPPPIAESSAILIKPVHGNQQNKITNNANPTDLVLHLSTPSDNIPPFPSSLRATQCSRLAALLTGVGEDATIVSRNGTAAATTATATATTDTSSAHVDTSRILSNVDFSLTSLVLEAVTLAQATLTSSHHQRGGGGGGVAQSSTASHLPSTSVFADTSLAPLSKPFDFSIPSPDDLTRTRLQAVPTRGSSTDALTAEQMKERALRKKRAAGTGGKFMRDGEDDEDRDEAFLHDMNQRAEMGGLLQLSTGSIGASSASSSSSSALLESLLADSKFSLTARPFESLHKSLLALKRALVEELVRAAMTSAILAQTRVMQPRWKEGERSDNTTASSSSSSSSPLDYSPLTEPWQPKGISTATHVISAFTPTNMPLQVAGVHQAMQASKSRGVEEIMKMMEEIELPQSIKTLYHRKRAIFTQTERLALPVHTKPLTEQAIELVTPTPQPSYLASLSNMNMLIVGAPQSGVSTLLGTFLYQCGRLPFSLVKPKSIRPNYWEQWQGQQFHLSADTAVVASNTNMKLNQWNQRRFNFKGYTHCVYTNRYRVKILHSNMGGLLQTPSSASPSSSSSSHSSSAASSKHVAPPTPQQMNLAILASLQSDFILLVVDGRGDFNPTPLMKQQMVLAYMAGVRQVILCVTRMDEIGWSEKKMNGLIAAVTSSFLKPLGFQSTNITSIPVSGKTGDNLLTRSSANKDLAWYTGPTLHQLLDRMTLPLHRQVESMADGKLAVQVIDAPKSHMSILNDTHIETVTVRVEVVSGTLLQSEPVGLAVTAKRHQTSVIGPIGMKRVEREECEDERDLATYEEEVIESSATAALSSSSSSSTSVSSEKSSSNAAPKTKLTHGADGKKLTSNERKLAEQMAKREFARKQAKEKSLARQANAVWNQYKEDEENDDSDDDDKEEESKEDGDNATGDDMKYDETVSSSHSRLPHPPSTSLRPSPMLLPGDVGVLTLASLHPPASNSDDSITAMLTGRDPAQFVAKHSQAALEYVAHETRPGDMFVIPMPSSSSNDSMIVHTVTHFKAEVFILTNWSNELHLKVGQTVTIVPLRGGLPSPAQLFQHHTGASLWETIQPPKKSSSSSSSPSSSFFTYPVQMDRLVNILNKSTRAALRKKPESLVGPAVGEIGDLATIEFSSSKPIVFETFNQAGPKLSNFLIIHQREVIAIGTVTGLN